MSAIERPATVVIGAGSTAYGDDGVGAAVLSVLSDLPGIGRRAVLARCDGDPARLVALWDGFDRAIVVGAARGGTERVGYVYRSELLFVDGVAGFTPAGRGCGFGQAVRLADVLGRLPRRLTFYAVHGHDFTAGERISDAVSRVVPVLAGRIRGEVLSAHRSHRPEIAIPQREPRVPAVTGPRALTGAPARRDFVSERYRPLSTRSTP